MLAHSLSARRDMVALVARRKMKSRAALCAAVERLEPRVLLTGTYSAANLPGLLALYGMNKNGSLTFDGSSAVTAGTWSNQSGPPATNVVSPSTYTVSASGQAGLSLSTEPANSTTSTTTLLTGAINGTRDVVALNEMSGSTPVADGLDLLVNASGSYTLANLAGTWNIAAQDFRGSITINAQGVITGGSVFIESTQKTGKILGGGTAVVNASGAGTLTFTTALATSSGFHSETLAFTMNQSHDVMAANSQGLGNGTAAAELTVLLKNSGTYAASDVVGTSWDFNSALGVGTMSFLASNVVTATVTTPAGAVESMTGTYILGGNGSITVNVFVVTQGGGAGFNESFTGVLNQHKNMIAMDRAIANGHLDSSLIVLTNPANHAPTERLVATWPHAALQITPVTFDYNTLVSDTVAGVHDLDADAVALKITALPDTTSTFTITHNSSTSAVIVGTTEMVQGDTLTWTEGATSSGLVNAFSIQADDGTALAANATEIFVNTGLLPAVSAVATKGNALEAKAGNSSGFGVIVLSRAGGDVNAPLTVTLQISGTAADPANYTLIGPNGAITGPTATVTFPARAKSITLNVEPIEDHVVDPTLTVLVRVVADPNTASPAYIPAAHPTATVDVLDSNPTIVIVPVGPSVKDGVAGQKAFFVERLPAQGGSLANVSNTVTITYSGTQNAYSGSQNVANDLPAGVVDNATTVTFTSNEVKQVIFLSPGEDGVAATEQITATISGTTFSIPAGMGSATVSVTDDAPKVRISTLIATAQEGATQSGFGEFSVLRDGNNTTNALTVAFTTSGSAVDGTNYTLVLASDTTQTLTSTVTIPAGASSVAVELIPLDDGLNDGTLTASINLVADATPSYHLGNGLTSSIKILNNNRFPTMGNATFSASSTHNTTIQFTYADLQTDTAGALAAGSLGSLQFQVGKVLAGHLQIKHGSGTFEAAGAKTIVSSGDTLKWIPPAGLIAANVSAFTLFGLDGNIQSLSASLVQITLT